jgi:hypothetical protein
LIREAKRALEEARHHAQAEQEERRREAEAYGRMYRPGKDPQVAVPKARTQRNLTDPDSPIMKSSDKAFIQLKLGRAGVAWEPAWANHRCPGDPPHPVPPGERLPGPLPRKEWIFLFSSWPDSASTHTGC